VKYKTAIIMVAMDPALGVAGLLVHVMSLVVLVNNRELVLVNVTLATWNLPVKVQILNLMNVMLDPVTRALGPIGRNGLTVTKDFKRDRKIVVVEELRLEMLTMVTMVENDLVLVWL
jgi:hypothetical protein